MWHKLLSLTGSLLGRGKLSILIYHQVFASRDPMRPSEPDLATFDWQMRLLSRYFTPLSLTDAISRLQNNTLPANAVCVTFDDGYLNNLTLAAPVLQKYQVPATVYVATAFSDGLNMWNDRIMDLCADQTRQVLHTEAKSMPLNDWPSRRAAAMHLLSELKYLPVQQRLQAVADLYQRNNASEYPARMMTPAQLRELASFGVEVGAHTHNHPILKVLAPAEQLAEMQQSKQLLEQWLGHPIRHFAYPNGVLGRDLDHQTISLASQVGFQSAVVTDWGYSKQQTPLYQLKRFTPWDNKPWRFHSRLIVNLLKDAH